MSVGVFKLSGMKTRQRIVISLFLLATAIVTSLLFLYSLNGFIEILSSQGLKKDTLSLLPQWLRPFYKGVPSLMTLLSYCLFTLSAFLLLKENNRKYKSISILSFILLLLLLVFLF